jgi:hypothetical protein
MKEWMIVAASAACIVPSHHFQFRGRIANVAVGSFAAELFSPRADQCPLLSKSGQNVAVRSTLKGENLLPSR